jgi:hypothetical protein
MTDVRERAVADIEGERVVDGLESIDVGVEERERKSEPPMRVENCPLPGCSATSR